MNQRSVIPLLSFLICFLAASAFAAKPQVAGGESHALALASNGSLFAWGDNSSGQLGDGSNTKRATPVAVAGIADVVAIAAGKSHNLALKADGTVMAWGNNELNQLGDGSSVSRSTPVKVSGLGKAVAVSAGDFFSLALLGDGTVWAWGDNGNGQLGDGTRSQRSAPVQVAGLSNVAAIAAGYYFSAALKKDGTVWTWGINSDGQLGDGTATDRITPAQVAGVSGGTAIAAGFGHVMVLKADGTLLAWGRNNHGQLSDGKVLYIPPESIEYRPSVAAMQGLSAGFAVAGGLYHSLVLGTNGAVKAVGGNIHGQAGNGASIAEDLVSPVNVIGVANAVSIGVGRFQSFVVTGDGAVYAFGKNDASQLGDGATSNRSTPAAVLGVGGSGNLNLGLSCQAACPVLAVVGSKAKVPGSALDVKLALNGFGGVTADLYVAVSVPATGLVFVSSNQMFGTPSFATTAVAYRAGITASDVEGSVFSAFTLPAGLPVGNYRLYAVLVTAGKNPLETGNWISSLSGTDFDFQ